jgi:dTDP-4-amino-4,6-dideoxygalactose transaminase
MLSIKLRHLDRWNAMRRQAMRRFQEQYVSMGVRFAGANARGESACHLNVVRVDERDAIVAALSARGVASGLHYPIPCHHQAPYRRYADGHLPVAEAAARQVLSLPLFPHITDGQIDRVCEALAQELHAKADGAA